MKKGVLSCVTIGLFLTPFTWPASTASPPPVLILKQCIEMGLKQNLSLRAARYAIVLVDYTNILRKRGIALFEAVQTAGVRRLRPVLMTTFTTIFGTLPMALSNGEGSEVWKPMGMTVIGGLAVSTLVTLLIVPVIYTFLPARGRGGSYDETDSCSSFTRTRKKSSMKSSPSTRLPELRPGVRCMGRGGIPTPDGHAGMAGASQGRASRHLNSPHPNGCNLRKESLYGSPILPGMRRRHRRLRT